VLSFLGKVKSPIKKLRHRARAAYVKRFHAFSPAQFRDMLHGLGIQTGDVLCVHSSFDQFLGFEGHVGDVLQSLQDTVGQDGGLVMPTQPFGGLAVEFARQQKITDLRRTPSRMGLLTEILRRTKGAVRSINPTHPVAAWGSAGVALVQNDWEAKTPCGRGTAYHRLLGCDAKILMLGTGIQAMTFYHCPEELIEPLMPVSPFTVEEFTMQTRDVNGKLYTSSMRLFEPGLAARRRMSLLVPDLKARGSWQTTRIGRLDVILLSAREVLEACRSMAERGEFCYLPVDTNDSGTQQVRRGTKLGSGNNYGE
jgi:aminoglycoside 3-N-acetyltransferase